MRPIGLDLVFDRWIHKMWGIFVDNLIVFHAGLARGKMA